MWSKSFLPQVRPDTRVLILGSMPGQVSLARQEYYAHPRNAFWTIMASLFGFHKDAPYAERLASLNGCKVGLWDVYAECYREGSLDSDIERGSAQCNDFSRLFSQYPQIHSVCFNGRAAESAFRRHLLPALSGSAINFFSMPSTSPAHAGMSLSEKLQAWQKVKELADDQC